MYIAIYVHDHIVRPHIGDVLVVILLYCFAKTFLNVSPWKVAIPVLLFSFLIETLQHFKIVEVLGLQHSTVARVVIGTFFSWIDIFCYIAGIVLVLIAEKIIASFKRNRIK